MLRHLDLGDADTPVAIFVPWQGSATFHRLDAFCRGVADGLRDVLARGHPIVLAGDGDVGGLIGIHFREEMKLTNPVVSIDGLELKQFDYIDIGELLESSGAVPVVIKSLIFPASAALGQEWMATSRGEAEPCKPSRVRQGAFFAPCPAPAAARLGWVERLRTHHGRVDEATMGFARAQRRGGARASRVGWGKGAFFAPCPRRPQHA